MGYDVDKLPDAEYTNMLRGNASTQMDLVVLMKYVQQFDDQCAKELNR